MYEFYLIEILPSAIRYGMTAEQFWHEDKRLFDAFQKSYYTGLHEKSWLDGLYFNVALCNLASNIFAKKGAKPLEYPDKPFDPFAKKPEKITKENLEEKFRDLMSNTSNWLKDRQKK